MGSKREEERNEKIIRGLMKLPPNRRCINCNSLTCKLVQGPQYVCTTFWTFVCMACSGIHREFTHRVKSVSMSKFTSQEVEVLQNGGNQRAREIYLKSWDHQRQRLPDNRFNSLLLMLKESANLSKMCMCKRNTQEQQMLRISLLMIARQDNLNHGSSEDVTRRANSYHSYSQSPPYDYQYEERRYGKIPLGLTGKSASVKGLHSKASSFVYSPGRFSDHAFEDHFANEGSAPRASDFSVSSGGDTFRSEIQSPNFQQEGGFRSPQFQHSNAPPSENLFPGRQHQRTTSSGSVRSVESNSMSIKSYTSSGLGEGASENGQNTGSQQDKTSTPVSSAAVSTKPPIDLFQLPGAPMAQSVNISQPSIGAGSPPPVNFHQPPPTYSSTPTDLLAGILGQQPDLSAPKNEGWASFDNPVPAAKSTNISISPGVPELEVKNEGIPQPSTSMPWPPYPSVVEQHALSVSSPWQDDLSNVLKNVTHTPPWNAFPDSIEANPLDSAKHIHQDGASTSSANTDQQHLEPQLVEELRYDGIQTATISTGSSGFGFPATIPAYSPHMVPEEAWQHVNHQKSANPFDLPYDSEFDSDDMFVDMSSLQGALPDIETPPTFLNGVSQPWLSADSVASYLPAQAGAQGLVGYLTPWKTAAGGLVCMAGQASTSQLQ
ncbi:unnamed protein product [Thlaspi arvense]|uniref:Arf-GAP domain-containing protein n=1 Tax=Thlaspi arvense TaxID=13288 RepID=A0AAU9RHY6_THLAR|nr:unnamed protein product [Thlaspi arvense]